MPDPSQQEPKVKQVVTRCKRCGVIDGFDVPMSGMAARNSGIPLAQAFADIPPERLKQLETHVCPACQLKEPK